MKTKYSRLYTGRIARGDRHHRHSRGAVAAGDSSGARSGPPRQCVNNLKQLGIAFQNYHDTYKQLPIGAYSCCWGTWQTAILPFIEEQQLADMYQFLPKALPPGVPVPFFDDAYRYDALDLTKNPPMRNREVCQRRIATLTCPSDEPQVYTGSGSPGMRTPGITFHNYVANFGNTNHVGSTIFGVRRMSNILAVRSSVRTTAPTGPNHRYCSQVSKDHRRAEQDTDDFRNRSGPGRRFARVHLVGLGRRIRNICCRRMALIRTGCRDIKYCKNEIAPNPPCAASPLAACLTMPPAAAIRAASTP